MSSTLEILEAEALKLPPADRSHLLERLIASLDSDPEVEDAWEREADRREAALESGSVAEVSGPEAVARLRDSQCHRVRVREWPPRSRERCRG